MPPLDVADHTSNNQSELVDDPLPTPNEVGSDPRDTQQHLEVEDENTTGPAPGNGLPSPPRDTSDIYVPWFGNARDPGILSESSRKIASILTIMGLLLLITNIIPWALRASRLWAWVWWIETWTAVKSYNPSYMPLIGAAMGLVHWFPVVVAYTYYFDKSYKKFHRVFIGFCGVAAFVLIAWEYCALVSNTNTTYAVALDPSRIGNDMFVAYPSMLLQAWKTGSMPECPQTCTARVAQVQQALFTAEVYETQFACTHYMLENQTWKIGGFASTWQVHPAFDFEPVRSIQSNLTLCDQGFFGNTDLYGLGIRCGVYLQWISSIFANHFLSTIRQDVQRVYLIFSLAICLATLISSSVKSCVFGIEIEVLYWMYWGCFMCVFGSAPCLIRLGSSRMWTKLDWTTAILFTTHCIMTFHGMWYIWHGYDQIFARMPCGTYHFFVAPVLDPSEAYWVLRDWLSVLAEPVIIWALIVFPLVSLLLLPEVKHAIQSSATYEGFFRSTTTPDTDTESTTTLDPSENSPSRLLWIYSAVKRAHIQLRNAVLLPGHHRNGIRLITPVDVQNRK